MSITVANVTQSYKNNVKAEEEMPRNVIPKKTNKA